MNLQWINGDVAGSAPCWWHVVNAGIGYPTWWVSGVVVQTDVIIGPVTSQGPQNSSWVGLCSSDFMMSRQRQLADGSVRTVLATCQTPRTSISICLHLVLLVSRSDQRP